MSVVTENKAAFTRIADFCSPALARSRYLNALSTVSNDLKTFFGNNRKLHQGQTCILI